MVARAAHDGITKGGFVLAAFGLTVVVVSFCIEIVGRYFFSSPTSWVSSLVSYILCAIIFLVLPDLTRQRSHIFISVLPDSLSQANATRLTRFCNAAAFVVCTVAALFCAEVTYQQYVREVATLNEWPVPKWVVSIVIPYGLLSSAVYYLRYLLDATPYKSDGAQGEAL